MPYLTKDWLGQTFL